MNIKSLLLGSAAALVAVSGARAADAVIAEPEPVEYVRVCDAYGAGFFYIPGTETCLRISGYVRYQIGAEGYDNLGDTPAYNYGASGLDGWYNNTRARLNFDARSETEWGTLQAFARIQGDIGNQAGLTQGFRTPKAYITLGNTFKVKMGYDESAYVYTLGGGASGYGVLHSDTGGSYGYQERQMIQVEYGNMANGFEAALSLEDDNFGGDGYIPDVVGKVGYGAAWGAVWALAAYDESADAFSAKVSAAINVPNMPGSSLRLGAFYSDDPNAYSVGIGPFFAEWSLAASYYHQFTPTLGAGVGFQYFSFDNNFVVPDNGYTVDFTVVWTPVTNFEVRTEIGYNKVDGLDGTPSGFLRFVRYF